MKKLFFMLIILFILYLGIQFAFHWFSDGQENEYKIKNDNNIFEVKEISNFDNNSYLYEIKINETNFSFQIFNDYNKDYKVLVDIFYYKDANYECILPVFKDEKTFTDVMCMNNGHLVYYHNLNDENVDNFVDSIKIYDKNKFIDATDSETKEGINIYKNNLIDKHYIGITNYKGFYNVNKSFNSIVHNISLFGKDIYNQKLGIFVDNYYVVADYNEKNTFNKINVINLITLKSSTIVSDKSISFDSYIQGIVDHKLYLYDKDNIIQYEIDPSKESIIKLSNEIKYYDGQWSTMSVKEAKEEKMFITNKIDYENSEYVKIDQTDSYYYLYKKNGNKYDCYRINKQNQLGLIYLFSTQSIDLINYVNNYVYFVDDNKIKVFNDTFGIKNIIEYKELEFNKNIKFYVYAD